LLFLGSSPDGISTLVIVFAVLASIFLICILSTGNLKKKFEEEIFIYFIVIICCCCCRGACIAILNRIRPAKKYKSNESTFDYLFIRQQNKYFHFVL
jgi:hypothetical protein